MIHDFNMVHDFNMGRIRLQGGDILSGAWKFLSLYKIILGDQPHTNNNYMSDDGGRLIEPQVVDIPTFVPDGWCSVMSTNDYLPWVPVDELLVKFLGLTKAYKTF